MMNGGEAADQMVSYAFKGGEVVLRLSGSAAKNLAVYLANALKEGGPSKGKTTLKSYYNKLLVLLQCFNYIFSVFIIPHFLLSSYRIS